MARPETGREVDAIVESSKKSVEKDEATETWRRYNEAPDDGCQPRVRDTGWFEEPFAGDERTGA